MPKPTSISGKKNLISQNLIEIRKPNKDEKLTQTIAVGEHEFDY